MMRDQQLGLVLMGRPASARARRRRRLREEFGLEHIATGDLLREHRARGTELGQAGVASS